MIIADKRDYKNGYHKHYSAYSYLKSKNDFIISRCLLLVYSVECGLKCLLLSHWKENTGQYIINSAEDDRKKILQSHSLQKLLVELGKTDFRFPNIKTKHGDTIAPDTYHQLYRYGIHLNEKDVSKMRIVEAELLKIIEWIQEVI